MKLQLSHALLAATLAATLSACGGGSGNNSVNFTDTRTATPDTGNPNTPPEDNQNNHGGGGGGATDNDDTSGGFTDDDEATVLSLIDSKNNFTVAVCPSTVLALPFGGAIDALTCENEALTALSINNNQVLGLLCADTVAAQPGSLPDTLAEPSFLPACLLESADFLQQNLTGLFDGTSPLLGDICLSADNIAECITDSLAATPETLFGVLEILGCDDPLDPQLCFTRAAERFASGELLLGTANTLSSALCPTSTIASDFDPASCVTEVLTGVGSVLGLNGGLEQLCGSNADPLTCLLEAGEQLGPVAELLGDNPLSADLIDNLIAALADPANADLLQTLPGLLDNLPVLGELLGDELANGGDLFAILGELGGLDGLLDNLPVLGDLLNGLLGGDLGALPGDLPLDNLELDSLLALLNPGDLAELDALFGDLPVLAELSDALLGALDCDGGDPLTCLTRSAGQLDGLGALLEEVPLLGEVLSPVLDLLLGTNRNNPLDSLTTVLSQVPLAGELLDTLLGSLFGDGDDLLNAITSLAEQPEGFQSVLEGLLGGLLSGDPEDLLDGILDGNGNLLEPVTSLLLDSPLIGDLIAGLLLDQLGENATLDILAPLGDGLSSLPVLGPILDGLLGGLFG